MPFTLTMPEVGETVTEGAIAPVPLVGTDLQVCPTGRR